MKFMDMIQNNIQKYLSCQNIASSEIENIFKEDEEEVTKISLSTVLFRIEIHRE